MISGPAKRVLLLPEKRRFTGSVFSPEFRTKARRFKTAVQTPGESAQLQRYFQCLPASWPMAALNRQSESGDAGNSQWLLADPIHLQMEMRDARIMAWDNLDVSSAEQKSIQSVLEPVFKDAGIALCSAANGRFLLRMATDSALPDFTPAPEVLGCALSEHLTDDRKWAALFNECQIILYNHPFNVERLRRGQASVNGLWFWGQGMLPKVVYHGFSRIESHADDIRALAHHGRQRNAAADDVLLDLRHMRDWKAAESMFDPQRETVFDFADGAQWLWKPNYRWFFWRLKSVEGI
jgi:hypothetical protein